MTHSPEGPSTPALFRELSLLSRYRVPFILNVLIITGAAIAYSIFAEEMYEASASLLPAEDQGSLFGGLSALIGSLPVQGANLPGVTTSTDLLSSIARSRRLVDPIVEEFDLIERYEAEHVDLARDQFRDRLGTGVGDEGILHLSFRDPDPEFAARLLNRHIELLNDYNVNQRMSRGRKTREFVELRRDQATAALDAAMDSLAAYQERNAIAVPPDQIAAAEGIGELLGRKLGLQIELEALGQYLNPSSPQMVQRQVELDALDRRVSTLPELGVEGARLYRDVEVQRQLYALLSVQYEQARIDENKDLALVEVLDSATAPFLRAWPKRKLIVISAFLMSVLVGLLLVHAIDFVQRERGRLSEALTRN